VQVDPIKSKLKPPGTERLKLNCDVLLSSSAFKFSLRHYTEEERQGAGAGLGVGVGVGVGLAGEWAGPGPGEEGRLAGETIGVGGSAAASFSSFLETLP